MVDKLPDFVVVVVGEDKRVSPGTILRYFRRQILGLELFEIAAAALECAFLERIVPSFLCLVPVRAAVAAAANREVDIVVVSEWE